MNIDFRNRTIFFKILSGFILLLVLAGLMGGVLFYSLGDVTGVLRRITERNAPSIRYPTGVERYALRTILDEKNYLLLQKKEIHEQAMQDIREIYANLDRVDQVATKFNDQVLLRKSGDVRRAVEEYQGYYNRGVALLEENKILEHKMRMLGRKMNDLSHAHALTHKKLLEEAIASGIDQRKYMDGFNLGTEIEKEALEARRQEKNYILYKKQEYFDGLKEHIASLNKLYDETTRVGYVFEHQASIAETRKATDEYLAAAQSWVANDNELRDILTRMHGIGVEVQETARSVQEAGWREMDTSKKRALHTTERASLTGILVAVLTTIIGIVLAFFIARGVAGPIKGLSLATAGIAKGDLSRRVAVKGRDEVGQLAISFNTMAENLQNTMVSRDYLDNIIKSMIDTLIVLDAEARIITVNPATCDVSGYTEEELIGQPVNIIFAEEEALFKGTGMRKLMQEGSVRDYDMTYQTKSGERIPVSFSGSVMYETGGQKSEVRGQKPEDKNQTKYERRFIGIVGIARDMREIKRLMQREKELAAAEKERAEELKMAYKKLQRTQAQLVQSGKMSAVGELAAGVAHEINNPLTGVLTYAVLLKETLEKAPQEIRTQLPEFPERLDLIKRSAERCKLIADNLLTFSRQSEPGMALVDLPDVISMAFELMAAQMRHNRIKLISEIPEGLPRIRGNPNQLQHVFINIALNAIHAMDSGGEITVCARADGPECEITISDTGRGISRENLDRIFEPFFTTKPIGKGTGLGLSIAYGIIQNHGGEITVDSVLGRGTTFRIKLPVVSGQ